ncbi:MAG: hypothetical protein QW638_05740 [Candidatus Bathyarchaeia archaeon]|nr:hypothetical protein [Candidatus Bathyarchaeota archaeon]
MTSECKFDDLILKRTLIVGDVGVGKTRMTINLLCDALSKGYSRDITIVDMAPGSMVYQGRKIGGCISDMIKLPGGVRYLKPNRIMAPRITASSPGELLLMVENNRKSIEPLLREFLDDPTPILFINDVSIYFQSGCYKKVFEVLEASKTFIGNGYYGGSLIFDYGTGVSKIERHLMDLLISKVDIVINLSESPKTEDPI